MNDFFLFNFVNIYMSAITYTVHPKNTSEFSTSFPLNKIYFYFIRLFRWINDNKITTTSSRRFTVILLSVIIWILCHFSFRLIEIYSQQIYRCEHIHTVYVNAHLCTYICMSYTYTYNTHTYTINEWILLN